MNEVKSGVWVNIYLSRPAASVGAHFVHVIVLHRTYYQVQWAFGSRGHNAVDSYLLAAG